MALSVRVSDVVRVYFDEKVSETEEKLNAGEIRYNILFDKETSRGIRETIINIPEYNFELRYENLLLKAVSMLNTDFTNVIKIGETVRSPIVLLKRVNNKFTEMTSGKPFVNYIEKLDTATMLCTFEVTFEDKKYKINLSKDGHGNTFIRNIKEISKG